MTDLQTDSTATQTEQSQQQEVVGIDRDAAFFRCSADVGLILYLGHDLEISFLQQSPRPISRVRVHDEKDQTEGFNLEPSLVETARVRMPPASAVNLAFNLIGTLIQSDEIDKDLFERSMSSMLELFNSDSQNDE